jgi:DNA-binding CsgD family transcriptional regulator
MRVLLIGTEDERGHLRKVIEERTIEVVGEAATIAEGHAADASVDALVIANTSPRADLVEKLTAREQEVLDLLAEGLSNKAIAARLAISEHTVKFHVAAVCAKLAAENRTDAVRKAVQQGLVIL